MMVRVLTLVVVAAALLTGCNRGAAEPEVVVGVSTCHRCRSIIKDLRWAAADSADTGTRLYDDPGCLLATRRDEGSGASGVVFQDRTTSRGWISASEVWLARSAAFHSPQGSGWAAFPTFAAAQDAITAAGSGEIVRFGEAISASGPTP